MTVSKHKTREEKDTPHAAAAPKANKYFIQNSKRDAFLGVP